MVQGVAIDSTWITLNEGTKSIEFSTPTSNYEPSIVMVTIEQSIAGYESTVVKDSNSFNINISPDCNGLTFNPPTVTSLTDVAYSTGQGLVTILIADVDS